MSIAVLDQVIEFLKPQESSAAALLSGIPEGRNSDLPEWFRARQAEAWARFLSLPTPNRKDQTWRFSNVNALDLAPFSLGQALDESEQREILDRSKSLE